MMKQNNLPKAHGKLSFTAKCLTLISKTQTVLGSVISPVSAEAAAVAGDAR